MYWMSVCICIIFSGKQIHWNWNWNWSNHLTLHKASHIDNNENDNNCYLPSQDLLFSDDQEVPVGYRKKWEVSTNKNTAQQSNTSFGYRTLIMKGISCDLADKQRQRNKRWNTNHTIPGLRVDLGVQGVPERKHVLCKETWTMKQISSNKINSY